MSSELAASLHRARDSAKSPSYRMATPPSRPMSNPIASMSTDGLGLGFGASTHAGSDTVSMPFVRRHVTRRLKSAKEDCNKEMQRITNSITAYFEQKLKESDLERDADRELRERDRMEREQFEKERGRHRDALSASPEVWGDGYAFHPADLKNALQSDDGGSESGAEYDSERRSRHSRQPSRHSGSAESSSPMPMRRQEESQTRNWREIPVGSPPSGTLSTHQSLAARRLSRTIHIPTRSGTSGQTSRSTSRSRSPLPPSSHNGTFSDAYSQRTYSDRGAQSPAANRRSSRILIDDPVDPLMTALYALIGVATEMLETTVAHLTANPKFCEAAINRVQTIGKAWDDHPDWHGRNWFVQILLAIASLSRVLEWWEAEKSFWNFDEKGGEEEEPLQFVTKFVDEDDNQMSPPLDSTVVTPAAESAPAEGNSLGLTAEEQGKLRLSRPPSHGKRSRLDVGDLAMSMASKEQEISQAAKTFDTTESARVLATERLRLQAETAQNRNVVVELGLDGDSVVWANYAWGNVVGTDPEELPGGGMRFLLHPDHDNVFQEATQRLLADDSHTIEVKFLLRVFKDENSPPRWQLMEGKGMLMIDREDGHPSHTMWVIKPAIATHETAARSPPVEDATAPSESEVTTPAEGTQVPSETTSEPAPEYDPSFPFTLPVNVAPILCRICEVNIPSWYFEKHNETCVETHRLEAEIMDCNEGISELRSTIKELLALIDRSSPATAPEYRGMPILSPSTSPNNSSTLSLFRGPLSSKVQKMGVKKMQRRLLEQLDDILQLAAEVEVPSLRDEEGKEPIERQTLLSPSSERKMTQVRNWFKPASEDGALRQLIDDTDRVMRSKMDTVIRMRNTIKYSEKVRQEWEERVLVNLPHDDDEEDEECDVCDESMVASEHAESEHLDQDHEHDDHSSTKSEYAYDGEDHTLEPTPIASSSPVPIPVGPAEYSLVSPEIAPLVAPRPHAPSNSHRQNNMSMHNTRASTPASVISSPLALVPPIVASPSPPPHMDLNEEPPLGASSTTLRSRRSTPSLQHPKLLITPPTSPIPGTFMAIKDDPAARKLHRRKSTTASVILSPTQSTIPISPRLPPTVTTTRSAPTTIKDFEIIKPISKGAFGSVFLARKKATGDYYAIKVLKKADMIAKNQITNVKAERMILMTQAESPFVAKLYFTFQNKENLFLVMEYLNGGDCANLVQALGTLPEEWAKNYIAEVALGLESLHRRGIVHRDLKPDNLLIDSHGHLKLTDFGLSRIGLLGRQTGDATGTLGHMLPKLSPNSRPPSIDMGYNKGPAQPSPPTETNHLGSSYFSHPGGARAAPLSRTGSSPYLFPFSDEVPGETGPDGRPALRPVPKANESPLASFATELTNDLRSHAGGTPPADRKFVGTPDYLAPETILGLRGDDAAVDWWALGVITYEFLYGAPPFHDETPERVFANILAGQVEYHEDEIEYSEEARDFMKRLLVQDPAQRLGSNGADEIKAHPWFADIDWDTITSKEAAFIPQVTDLESTEYFNARGAVPMNFQDDEPHIALRHPTDSPGLTPDPAAAGAQAASAPVPGPANSLFADVGDENFGSFSYKNVPVLKQANDEILKQMRTDQMLPLMHTLSEPSTATSYAHNRRRSVSARIKKPPSVVTSFDPKNMPTGPPSPATSTSSVASSPSRNSMTPSTPGSAGHARKGSEMGVGAVDRFRVTHSEDGTAGPRRTMSGPSRLRTASVSTGHSDDGSGSDVNSGSQGDREVHTPPSSVASLEFGARHDRGSELARAERFSDSGAGKVDRANESMGPPPKPDMIRKSNQVDLRKQPDPQDRAVTCLLAEDNPITAKIIETLLIRLGCRCVVVADGSEAISVALGDIHFDVILMDLQMPVLDGESAARYIKSTNSRNTTTPIVAVSAYSNAEPVSENPGNALFSAYIAKPVQKSDLLAVMRRIGFKTSTAVPDKKGIAKVSAVVAPAVVAPVPVTR